MTVFCFPPPRVSSPSSFPLVKTQPPPRLTTQLHKHQARTQPDKARHSSGHTPSPPSDATWLLRVQLLVRRQNHRTEKPHGQEFDHDSTPATATSEICWRSPLVVPLSSMVAIDAASEGVYCVFMTTKKIRVNFHLTVTELEALRARSESTGLSVADLIRRAVDAYLATKRNR